MSRIQFPAATFYLLLVVNYWKLYCFAFLRIDTTVHARLNPSRVPSIYNCKLSYPNLYTTQAAVVS
jgi:hypothetical protein